MDPDVRRFFFKVLNSIFLGLLWMIACATAGIYFELAYGWPGLRAILFFSAMLVSFILLAWYYYRAWKDGPD